MKYLIILFIVTAFCMNLVAQTSIPPSAGNGSEEHPYQIANLNNLYWIAASSARWGFHFIQTSDIDASETANWFDGSGWNRIGTSTAYFTGTYNGQDHIISGLRINRSGTDDIGLFGYIVEAVIENLGLTFVNVTGRDNVGALVGLAGDGSLVNNCYSTGIIKGRNLVGGLVGQNLSVTMNSYSLADVIGTNDRIGGLVGANWGDSLIMYSYSAGTVSGYTYVGGLVGINSVGNLVSNSYSHAVVQGINYVGGLSGSVNRSRIEYSYSTGSVSGSNAGGLTGTIYDAGEGFADVVNYWNIETSGQANSSMGEGRTTDHMTYPYSAHSFFEWDFVDIWAADMGYDVNWGYPYLRDDITVAVDNELIAVTPPITVSNYPNPFNPETTIAFSLSRDTASLSLYIYNSRGQLIRKLITETPCTQGEYQVVWDGKNYAGKSVASGLYFYRVSTPENNKTSKMLLLK